MEGNEINYHQLLTSSFILNHTTGNNQYPLYPFALSFSNHLSRRNQLRLVTVPDVHPASALEALSTSSDIPASERMSMTAADFCVLYQQKEYEATFDAVCTVFFIDTAPNLLAYIETVKKCLKRGGVWINLGPLLWHFESGPPVSLKHNHGESLPVQSPVAEGGSGAKSNEGIGEAGSVELTEEEIVKLLEHYEFTVERHETDMVGTWALDPESMLQNVYRSSFWVARKRA